MLKFISNLINLNSALAGKARAVMAYDQALALHGNKAYKQALPLMIEASELGNVRAMSLLGTMYLMGHGVKADGAQAVLWLKRAVDGGFDEAISVLGMAYATGKAGVKIDIPKAREMLSQCAATGDEQSARMLTMMDRGEGMFSRVKKNKPTRS